MPKANAGKGGEQNRGGAHRPLEAVRGSRILVLGIAYKKNVDDVRAGVVTVQTLVGT